MDLQQKNIGRKSLYTVMLITGIIFTAFNLRPAITSVGPLVGLITKDMKLSHWSAGLLTSLPLLAFFIMSPFVPRLANKFSNERSLIFGFLFIFAGISLRSLIASPVILFAGTFLIGIGIAICNVLLPSIVKENFPAKVGIMTSTYSTAMGVFASLASGLSVPLAEGMNLGWKGSLAVWAIPAILAVFVWIYLSVVNRDKESQAGEQASGKNRMWKSLLAWQVALFFGFQSLLFYVTVTWLPEILVSKGYSMQTAGWLLSFLQIIGLPANFIVPILAEKLRNQQWLALTLAIMSGIGYALLMAVNSQVMNLIAIFLIGFPLGGSFSLGLTFLAVRAKDSKQSSELSGMAQSFGYLISALGPILIGSLFDLTKTWDIPLIILVIITLLVGFFGWSAGKNRFV